MTDLQTIRKSWDDYYEPKESELQQLRLDAMKEGMRRASTMKPCDILHAAEQLTEQDL